MLAGSLRSRGIIRQASRQHLVFAGIRQPYFSNGLRLFLEYRQRVALYSAYRQRVGDTSSVAAAKVSVSARHAKRAWWGVVTGHGGLLTVGCGDWAWRAIGCGVW